MSTTNENLKSRNESNNNNNQRINENPRLLKLILSPQQQVGITKLKEQIKQAKASKSSS